MSSSTEPTGPSPIRLAVLACDKPITPVLAARGDYGDVFRALLRNSVPSPAVDFVVDAFDVRDELEYPEDIDRYAAVLISGSCAFRSICVPRHSLTVRPGAS